MRITITKVVTRNIVVDIYSAIQNIFGANLTQYERMIKQGVAQIEKELKGKKLKWYRYEITQLSNGAIAILFYGDTQ